MEPCDQKHARAVIAEIDDLFGELEQRLNEKLLSARLLGRKRHAQEAASQLSLLAEIKDRAGIGEER